MALYNSKWSALASLVSYQTISPGDRYSSAKLIDPDEAMARMNRDDATNLQTDEEEFWEARTELAQLRDFARARQVGPWSMFGVVLARAVMVIPPSVVLPALRGGQKATATITAADIRAFRAEMLSLRPRRSYDTRSDDPQPKRNADGTPQMTTLSRSTVKKAYDILRRILDLAVIDGALKATPVHSVPLPPPRWDRPHRSRHRGTPR